MVFPIHIVFLSSMEQCYVEENSRTQAIHRSEFREEQLIRISRRVNMRPESFAHRYHGVGVFFIAALIGTVTGSCPAAVRSAGRCQIFSENDVSEKSGSGQSGSGDNNAPAMESSVNVFRFALQNNAFESVVAISQENDTTSATDRTTDTNPEVVHWTSSLTQLQKLAENKSTGKNPFRQYLEHTAEILLGVRPGKKNASLGISSRRRKWTNILKGAELLLDTLHTCFPYSSVNSSSCAASTNNVTGGTGFSRNDF